jgi:F-type H+-transporting ATPase subunit delta
MLSAVAARYARALMDAMSGAMPESDAAATLEQLRAIANLIHSSADLHNALLSPAVPASRKRAVMGKLVQELGAGRMVRNFVYVIIDHRRVDEFPAIVEAFEAVLDERLGYVRADVLSARPLPEAQQARLASEISRVAGKKAKLKFSTDAGLVAGVVARIGSTVYDGSVRGQLERLRGMLAKA